MGFVLKKKQFTWSELWNKHSNSLSNPIKNFTVWRKFPDGNHIPETSSYGKVSHENHVPKRLEILEKGHIDLKMK